jgi:phosphoribosylformimino-5-aminoimidazole carboxamide ribotide isomerase
MVFLVIPAIDIKDGKVTRLIQGDFNRIAIQLENPVEIARKWVELGAKCLHVIDLDGAYHGSLRHQDIILRIRESFDGEIQVGGGIRERKVVETLIESGIDRVILGTVAIRNQSMVEELANSFPGRIMVAVDSKEDRVAVDGWREKSQLRPQDIIKQFEELEVSFLYTNIDVEGLVSGADYKRIEHIVNMTERDVYVAGGISSLEDISFAKESGAKGVVIGSALYRGKIDFSKAIKLQG